MEPKSKRKKKMPSRSKLPCRRPKRGQAAPVEDDFDGAPNEEIPGDDCPVVGDDFGDDEHEENRDEHEENRVEHDENRDEHEENRVEHEENRDEHEENRYYENERENCYGDDLVPVEDGRVVLANYFWEFANEDEESGDSGYDIWDEEKIPDPLSSEDEEEEERRHDREYEESPEEILALGKTFGCAADFKRALVRYTLKTKYDIKLYMSTQKKLGAICSDKEYDCKWRCYCSYEKRKHKLQIKIYESKHVCIRSGYSKMLKTTSIAELYDERLRVNPKFTAVEMADDIYRVYGFTVTEEQCRKAKTKITRSRRASHEAHFARIWDYEAEILQSNKGTSMEIETVPGPKPGGKQRFDRLYICFEAQRVAWKTYCRPIIGLDGAFLKWDVKGQLLAAVGRDGDNRIVPIAWAVVEIENDVNWDWFVKHLKRDLGLGDGIGYTIISDKQKGLVKAVHNELPEAEHRMCARHILGNWKRDSHDMELERLFWKIARSYTKGDYDENLLALHRHSPVTHASLLKTKPETWSRAFFNLGSFCNDNLNNLSESFNRTINEARRKPLLEMLEDIRRKCMIRHAKRSVIANRLMTRFTKSAHLEIELSNENAKHCTRHMATGNIHEIEEKGCGYRVDIDLKTCGCGKWQLIGIPCAHAACVIIAKKRKVDNYVSDYYTTRIWRLNYERGIEPVQGMKLWPRLNRLPVLPPPNRLGNRGRPKSHDRKKSANETTSKNKTKLGREHRVITCSNCKEEGHNKLTCSKASVEPALKRPRGRPRKKPEDEGSQLGSQLGSQGGSQLGVFF